MSTKAEEKAYERGIIIGWEKCLRELSQFLDTRRIQLEEFKRDEYETKKKNGVFQKVK